jgi:hypothetical protein
MELAVRVVRKSRLPRLARGTPDLILALQRFKDSRPFEGTLKEKKEKFMKLHEDAQKIFDVNITLSLPWGYEGDYCSSWSMGGGREFIQVGYVPRADMVGLKQVWDYLRFLGYAMGLSHRAAAAWATRVMRKVWPEVPLPPLPLPRPTIT